MNIVKKYAIPYNGLSVGKHNFDFEIHDDFFTQFEGSEILGGSLRVGIDLMRTSNGMTLEVVIEGEVKVECDRCLEECEVPVDIDDQLVVRVSQTEEQYDGEVMWTSPMQGEVDLTQYLYESVVLGLPYQKVHGDDQNGNPLCNLEMLKQFKIVSTEEFAELTAPKEQSEGRNAQWEKLKDIKEKLNK